MGKTFCDGYMSKVMKYNVAVVEGKEVPGRPMLRCPPEKSHHVTDLI